MVFKFMLRRTLCLHMNEICLVLGSKDIQKDRGHQRLRNNSGKTLKNSNIIGLCRGILLSCRQKGRSDTCYPIVENTMLGERSQTQKGT